MSGLNGKRVLVTGGTGFIGARLVEALVRDRGARVRVLVRNFARAPRIGRFPLEFVSGDVTDAGVVRRAVEGCDVVVHCAYGNSGNEARDRATTVEGTRNVLEAAVDCGVDRLVHLSTVVVYGEPENGPLDERAPRADAGSAYARCKIEAEDAVFDCVRNQGLGAVVLQPTVVYGPFDGGWTSRTLRQLGRGRVILVDEGAGIANAVYVDDVVQAVLAAALRDEAIAESFLISGPDVVTWRQFYHGFAGLLGLASGDWKVEMSAEEAIRYHEEKQRRARSSLSREVAKVLIGSRELRRRLRSGPELAIVRGAAKLVLPSPVRRRLRDRLRSGDRTSSPNGSGTAAPEQNGTTGDRRLEPLSPSEVRFFARRATVDSAKARRLLDYRPAWTFEEGLRQTGVWARWAHLI